RTHPGNERGVALILVLTSVAIITAVSVDFSFNSRIDLELATNARDELRAYYLARSSVNLSRLVLKFQKQLDSTPMGFDPSMLMGLLGGGGMPPAGALGAAAGAAGAGMPPGGGGGGLPIRLWQMVPIDCSVLQMLLAGAGSSGEPGASASLAPAFGGPGAWGANALGGKATGGKPQLTPFGDFDGCFHAEME